MTYHQTDRLAGIFSDLGIASVASVAVPSLIDKGSLVASAAGAAFASMFLCLSIYLSK